MARNPACTSTSCFFKILIRGFKEKLKIPPAFFKHLNGKLRGKFSLKIGSGRVWHVKVKRVVNDLFFDKGWQDFVRDTSLQLGELLVFWYDGAQTFDVKIFGISGCEKEVFVSDSFRSEEMKPPAEKQKKEKYFAESRSLCHCYKRGWTKAIFFAPSKENCKNIKSGDPIKLETVSDESYCTLKIRNPHFCARWRKSGCYNQRIPKMVVIACRLINKELLTLRDPHGRLWHVKIMSGNNGPMMMSAGLSGFCKENKVQEGDVLCYEFIQDVAPGTPSYCQVHIFKVGE